MEMWYSLSPLRDVPSLSIAVHPFTHLRNQQEPLSSVFLRLYIHHWPFSSRVWLNIRPERKNVTCGGGILVPFICQIGTRAGDPYGGFLNITLASSRSVLLRSNIQTKILKIMVLSMNLSLRGTNLQWTSNLVRWYNVDLSIIIHHCLYSMHERHLWISLSTLDSTLIHSITYTALQPVNRIQDNSNAIAYLATYNLQFSFR